MCKCYCIFSNQQVAGQNLLFHNPGNPVGYGGHGQDMTYNSGGHGHSHDHSGHGHSHDNHAYVR